jgi:radical SAM superfamily enzyme YgiQ (UPF0313 family)
VSPTAPVLVLGCYELGRPPLGVAWPRAFLREAGIDSVGVDLAVSAFPDDVARQAPVVVIAVPMHTALRIGVTAAERVRRHNPQAHVVFHGLYAWLNREHLRETGLVDSVLAGESEAELVRLVRSVLSGAPPKASRPILERLAFPVPDRSGEAPLDQYAAFLPGDAPAVPAAHVEASRGCLHTCRHCPIVPVYGGRFFAVPVETVLADVAQQVERGARHLTFGDPDFLNGPGHARRVAAAVHERFPGLTFDFTAKVEHLLRHRALLPELALHGARLVTSAVESLSPVVLERLRKGHTRAEVEEALLVTEAAGLALQPTFVAFTPWGTLDDFVELVDWIRARGLRDRVPPVQMSIRLLVPPGSALLEEPDTARWLGPLEPSDFGYAWAHPDPRVDALWRRVSARVQRDAEAGEPAEDTWEAIRELARDAAGLGRAPYAAPVPPAFRPTAPRLSEHWFC